MEKKNLKESLSQIQIQQTIAIFQIYNKQHPLISLENYFKCFQNNKYLGKFL